MEKAELLEVLEDERQELLEMLEDLPDALLLEPGVQGEWSIRDILAHLGAWEGQLVTLLFQAMQGIPRPTTAHFGKETDDEVNQRWHLAGKDRPLEMVWQDWLGTRKQVIRRVSEMSETDLNDPKRFPWQNNVPLYQWVLDSTVLHEEEHADAIREWLEEHDQPPAGSNGKK